MAILLGRGCRSRYGSLRWSLPGNTVCIWLLTRFGWTMRN